MMEDPERYKNKIKSMQKYVPLLSKLIKQLEEISESTKESEEKINQLKILQQQLCDPKPGILLEELNKCEQILENLFESQDSTNDGENKETPMLQMNEPKERKQKSYISLEKKQENLDTSNETVYSISIEKKCTEQLEKFCQPDQCKSFQANTELNSTPDTTDNNNLDTQTVSPVSNDNSEESKTILDQTSCLESSKSADDDNNIKDCNKAEDNNKEMVSEPFGHLREQNEKEHETLDESFEEANVEIIEFSENECDDSGELIVPDDASPFINQSFDIGVENEESSEENEAMIENIKSTLDHDEQNKDVNIEHKPTQKDAEKGENSKIPERMEQQSCNEKFNNNYSAERESSENSTNAVEQNDSNKNLNNPLGKEPINMRAGGKDLYSKEISNKSNEHIDPKDKNAELLCPVELVENEKTQREVQEMSTIKCASTKNDLNSKETSNKNNEHIDSKNKNAELLSPVELVENEKTQGEDQEMSTIKCESTKNDLNSKETFNKNNEHIDPKAKNAELLSPVELVENAKTQREGQEMSTIKCTSTQNGQKRSANECNDESAPKKQKLSDILNAANEENIADPLAIENENTSTSMIISDCTYENNDDVEIIEQRSSPILIESDDDEKLTEPIEKTPVKRIGFAFKSTYPHKNRDKELNNIGGSKPNINNAKRKVILNPVLKKTSQTHLPKPRTPQTNFLSNIDLQPNQQKNPRLFKTQLGQKDILIPNAFYGCPSHRQTLPEKSTTQENMTNSLPSNASPDSAHCRWLNNFLHHFCTPRNIAHNTCYLLLQRALRQDDFDRISRQRSAMKQTDKEMDNRLLCQLRNIFYADGNHMMGRLTYVGRKFCQLAFVNILDKTISLTTDSVTNAVTSRTRISATTLQAARLEMLNSNTVTTDITLNENDLINQNAQNTISKDRLAITPASQNSSLKKRREDDDEYCPPREIVQISVECPPRRSLRNSLHRQSASKNSKSFTYSETEEDENILNNQSNHQDQEKREKPNLTAATEAYITRKRLAAIEERQKKAKSFETEFIENVSDCPEHKKVSLSSTSKEFSSTGNDSDVFVISDDEDDIEEVEPKPHLILKKPTTKITNVSEKQNDFLKNTSTARHSMSKFTDYCLLCNRAITRVVGHYVNTHPNDEVFISRPSPKMAKDLLNNKLGLAEYDRLQNGLNLYIANCVFCEKKGSFTLPYWYQHFASHTGEYAFRCTGCGLKKPTRSQLSWHVRQNCTKYGSLEVIQDYDLSILKINGYTCRVCYYTQLNQGNVLRHLKNQHGMRRVDKCQWAEVTLLDIPKSIVKGKNSNNPVNISQSAPIYVQGGDNEIFEIAEIDDVDYTSDNNSHPVVVNEAEGDGDWYGDPSVMGDNMPFMSDDIDNQIKHE